MFGIRKCYPKAHLMFPLAKDQGGGFEVLMTVTILCDVAPHSVVEFYRCC